MWGLPAWQIALLAAAVIGLGVVGALVLFGRRRRKIEPDTASTAPVPTAMATVEASEPPLAAPSGARPAITLDLTIQQAGIDGDQLCVAFEIALHNEGEVAATDLRLHVELRTEDARAQLPTDDRPAQPIDQPMAKPFALDPDASIVLAAKAVLPVAQINRLMLQGRPMCVPVVALSASYRWAGGGKAELGVDYLIGINRPGNPRLGPFWLDVPPRRYDRIGMRLHGAVRKR